MINSDDDKVIVLTKKDLSKANKITFDKYVEVKLGDTINDFRKLTEKYEKDFNVYRDNALKILKYIFEEYDFNPQNYFEDYWEFGPIINTRDVDIFKISKDIYSIVEIDNPQYNYDWTKAFSPEYVFSAKKEAVKNLIDLLSLSKNDNDTFIPSDDLNYFLNRKGMFDLTVRGKGDRWVEVSFVDARKWLKVYDADKNIYFDNPIWKKIDLLDYSIFKNKKLKDK